MKEIDEFSEEIRSKSFMECLRLRNEMNCRVSAFESGQGDIYLDKKWYYQELMNLSLLCRYMAEKYKDNDYYAWR